ncbi:hypothetical protein HOY80DRAFT_1079565 [Tuber brumale]|nr:hypothetical protein HOY80DRAFT_1079565 [Tuber brumale]
MWTNNTRTTTGTNSIPIGRKRHLAALMNTDEDKTSLASVNSDQGMSRSSLDIGNGVVEAAPKKIARTPNDASFANAKPADNDEMPRGRQRLRRSTAQNHPRSRWGSESIKSTISVDNLPTSIPGYMSLEDTEMYVLKVRIEEITQKLTTNMVVPNDKRSLSPDPIYDMTGRRTNVRETRYRERLEAERHDLVAKALQMDPQYKPPSQYRRPVTKHEKVYVPVDDYPEINFIGLLIGPRGHTLKRIERDSGAKVAIRGKGSIKEGKAKGDLAVTSDQDENLHCLIISSNPASTVKAREMINEIIETAASTPETMNTLKRNQLRELATLNGTLRDDEGKTCSNCGEVGHRRYDCPKETNYTAGIICRVCGNGGHFGRDCLDRPKGQDWQGKSSNPDPQDQEYDEFLRDVLGGAGPTVGKITTPSTETNLQQVGDNSLGRELGSAKAPWKQVGGTLVKPTELSSTAGEPPWRRPSTSFIKPHEIREYPMPKGPQAPWGQARPWSQAGISANEGPGGMGQFQNGGNKNSRGPFESNGFPESIGSRERVTGAGTQSGAGTNLSAQKYPSQYTYSRDSQGYSGDRRMAHGNLHDFQNPISSKNLTAGYGGPQSQHLSNSYHSLHPQAYPPVPGHPRFHQTIRERLDSGLHPHFRPPPPPMEAPPPSPPPPPPPPPSYTPSSGFISTKRI